MSRRSYQKKNRVRKSQSRRGGQREGKLPNVDVQLPLCREELVAMMQDSLASFATEMGLRVATKLLEDEVERRCGPRYEHQENRQLTRSGRERGVVTLAGQRLPIARPRVRRTDSQGEVELETYDLLQRDEAMPEACLRRMLRGVSTRDYERVVDLAAEGFGVKRSSVSRGFVKATAQEVHALAERRFDVLVARSAERPCSCRTFGRGLQGAAPRVRAKHLRLLQNAPVFLVERDNVRVR